MNGALLDVPGARLYHEVHGSGAAVLLLIPGGNGDTGPYAPVARALAGAGYTVVSYDRRGYSRSPASTPPPPEGWLATDVTDALALLDRYSPGAPALVMGSSSGAIVGLELLARHPQRVRRLVAHEPPLLGLLPDAADHRCVLDAVYDTALRDGPSAAMAQFNRHAGLPEPQLPPLSQLPPEVVEMIGRMSANLDQFLRSEMRQYPATEPDWAALAQYGDRLVLAGGEQSHALLPYQPSLVLARRLGLPVVDLPGAHIGYATDPTEFAAALDTALSRAPTG